MIYNKDLILGITIHIFNKIIHFSSEIVIPHTKHNLNVLMLSFDV